MSICIIGANSFLSQALIERLQNSYNIIQVFNKNKNNLNSKITALHIDEFFTQKLNIDYIFFIASQVNYEENFKVLKQLIQTNILLLKRISQSFPNAKIIHTSSVSVYKNENKILTENSELGALSSYGISKFWAEQIVNNHQTESVNVRISSMFGPEMKLNTFLPIIIKDAILKKRITLYGNGQRKQNYIYVDDVALYLENIMKNNFSGVCLAVNENSYSNLEIAKIIKEFVPNTEIIFEGNDNSMNCIYDNSLTKENTNTTITCNFKEQMLNTIKWFQKRY